MNEKPVRRPRNVKIDPEASSQRLSGSFVFKKDIGRVA
jgi:hypothetical protein